MDPGTRRLVARRRGIRLPAARAPGVRREHPLFIIYTSGTTGRPKGLVHTSGGYLTHASWAHWAHFNAKPDDVHWCTADLAWVTAHTYEIYGPLSNGLTQVIYEGTPDTPHRGRHLEIIERYGVTTYYTAPTLIRSLMGWYPTASRGTTSRASGSWDPWGRPSTRGLALVPPGDRRGIRARGRHVVAVRDRGRRHRAAAGRLDPQARRRRTRAAGFLVDVVDDDGEPAADGEGGLLVIQRPWPGMARTVWGDPDRYRRAYWERFADRGWFLAGDGARRDADGDIALQGRIDEVVNVSGHRLSTIEIESALVAHPRVGEAGVTGVADDLTGQRVVAFVVPGGDDRPADDDADGWAALAAELGPVLTAHVARAIGPVAKPAGSSRCRTCPRRARARSCAASWPTSWRAGPSGRHEPAGRGRPRPDPRGARRLRALRTRAGCAPDPAHGDTR
ncbi:Acetyl-coenzyme A synthetase [Clavibacter michiganensis subsp. michiganensis]|uniref:acetate--CoA ligase n=1 Tax=Clavibacter michiganensis subsp. michiganensis TaxID=33013 RepID=A0A251XHR1_CLAMM|nr:Acetyl-coenzyme A synthetase [Clavibacter michiganensis subsp. michiganensis]OUE02708.1 Acetyl-coenzyme A synthetase [Clavibacter michiganensis subsp. michiganensis]